MKNSIFSYPLARWTKKMMYANQKVFKIEFPNFSIGQVLLGTHSFQHYLEPSYYDGPEDHKWSINIIVQCLS